MAVLLRATVLRSQTATQTLQRVTAIHKLANEEVREVGTSQDLIERSLVHKHTAPEHTNEQAVREMFRSFRIGTIE
ncbi:hypothetical protein Y032_0083g1621 [Ancylostoma ceylanicum]|uniref:Uncharacterized protein n=1 Tax=Ancylostoma ceylanicum TaxID=53326 RepID=A0A016TRX7_9BILA|nr:hypothetical protein Y032_0083g1621 [Ancylostoma ceylanicum]